MSEQDIAAISSWERAEVAPDPNEGGSVPAYRCTVCAWVGREALAHYRATGHAIRGKHWPANWGNCLFSTTPLVKVCAWCADAMEQTASARAHGLDVTHIICDVHRAEFEAGR